jgi:hypothetical protein
MRGKTSADRAPDDLLSVGSPDGVTFSRRLVPSCLCPATPQCAAGFGNQAPPQATQVSNTPSDQQRSHHFNFLAPALWCNRSSQMAYRWPGSVNQIVGKRDSRGHTGTTAGGGTTAGNTLSNPRQGQCRRSAGISSHTAVCMRRPVRRLAELPDEKMSRQVDSNLVYSFSAAGAGSIP